MERQRVAPKTATARKVQTRTDILKCAILNGVANPDILCLIEMIKHAKRFANGGSMLTPTDMTSE
jgi:hypothetical protein